MIPLIAQASTEIIAAQESTDESIAQEENWRMAQLEGSIQMEQLLHRINAQSTSDLELSNEPDLLGVYQFPFDSREMKKRGLQIAPFVRSRRMKSSNDKTFKPPPRIEKVDQIRTLVERLNSNPDSPVTDKEDSWLWRMYECLNDPWVLSAVVERSVAETAPAPEEPSVLDRMHIFVSPLNTSARE